MFVPSHSPRKKFLLDTFDQVDPWGLVESGAPPAEYEPEVEYLLRREEEGTPVTPLLVLETFLRYGTVEGAPLPPMAYGTQHPSISQKKAEALAAAFHQEEPYPSRGAL